MGEGEFEWNAAKAESNLAKHGVGFEAARRVFDDAFAFERCDFDSAQGEIQYVITGMASGPGRAPRTPQRLNLVARPPQHRRTSRCAVSPAPSLAVSSMSASKSPRPGFPRAPPAPARAPGSRAGARPWSPGAPRLPRASPRPAAPRSRASPLSV